MPSGSLVAVSSEPGTFAFLYVGDPEIDRRIVIVQSLDEATAAGADWAVLQRAEVGCRTGWKVTFRSPPWLVLRRDQANTEPCPAAAPAHP